MHQTVCRWSPSQLSETGGRLTVGTAVVGAQPGTDVTERWRVVPHVCMYVCIIGARECSPVLTAIHHSNGRFCDFLLFFQGHAWGSDRQPIIVQNGLNDADSGKDVPFGVKIESFCTTWPQPPKTTKIWPLLVWTWKIFAQFRFSIRGLTSKHP